MGDTVTLNKDELASLIAEKTAEMAKQSAVSSNNIGGVVGDGITSSNVSVDKSTVTITASPEEQVLSDPTGGFQSFGHYCREIVLQDTGRGASPLLRQWKDAVRTMYKTAGHMEEGDLSQGGELVPEQFMNDLLKESLEESIVKKRCRQIPMGTNRIRIPVINESSHATHFFGGVQIYRPDEAGEKTPSKPKLGHIALTLHKLVGLVYVSDELIEDSVVSLGPLITSMFGEAIAFTEDDDYLNGTGVNMALGAFNAGNPSLIAQAKETGQAANTILAENIIKMWSRLYPTGHKKAVWIANIDTFPQLATMALSVGTGGIPVWLPAQGLAESPNGTLMGRPLILTEKMQTLGTQGDIGLADFSKYFCGTKGGLKMATSMHIKFDYDETAYRLVLRYDGQPAWLNTLTPKRSTTTLSPFVTLAVRS